MRFIFFSEHLKFNIDSKKKKKKKKKLNQKIYFLDNLRILVVGSQRVKTRILGYFGRN